MGPTNPNNHCKNKISTPALEKTTKIKSTNFGIFSSIEDFAKNGMGDILNATKSVNALPQGTSRDLYCAHPSFGRIIDEQSNRILGIISKVLKWQNIKGNIQLRQHDEQFEMLLECNDAIFERLNSNLDEMAFVRKHISTTILETGLKTITTSKSKSTGAGSWNVKNTPSQVVRLIAAKNIERPQINFQVPIDNSFAVPFIPRLKEKLNSLKPLCTLPEYDESGNISSYLHPYEFELDKFEVSGEQLKRKSPAKPNELQLTDIIYVDTVDGLKNALNEIRQYTEIAIDLEHHSYRSFLGFTCLVQISTRKKDYVFDALKLREDMWIFNEIFTDSKVLKIFHGADSDINWLQRDLSLYIVNMFDTHQAAKALNFPRLSLSYLLKHYCNVNADKSFQLADWRIRPLSSTLLEYASQDTHYLIYIYECLTNDILDASSQKSNLLRSIYQRSKEICKQRYVKPGFAADYYMDVFRKSKRTFDNRQLHALRELVEWRDTIARQEDESYGYVLPNHMMLQIAESLPREMQGILACCNPIPPLVRLHLHTLHQIILRAREQPLVKASVEAKVTHRATFNNFIQDYNSKLYCPHDLSHNPEFRDDLPTLLSFQADGATRNQQPNEVKQFTCRPILRVFNNVKDFQEDDILNQKLLFGKIQIIRPYQRYLTILPIVEKDEQEARIVYENKTADSSSFEKTQHIVKELPFKTPENEIDKTTSYNVHKKKSLKRKHDDCNDDHTECDAKKERNLISDPSVDVPKNKKLDYSTVATHKKKMKQKHTQQADRKLNANFDYQKVDFKKFQGGAQRAKCTEVRPQLNAKRNTKNANNKKCNKLFTFSNVRNKK